MTSAPTGDGRRRPGWPAGGRGPTARPGAGVVGVAVDGPIGAAAVDAAAPTRGGLADGDGRAAALGLDPDGVVGRVPRWRRGGRGGVGDVEVVEGEVVLVHQPLGLVERAEAGVRRRGRTRTRCRTRAPVGVLVAPAGRGAGERGPLALVVVLGVLVADHDAGHLARGRLGPVRELGLAGRRARPRAPGRWRRWGPRRVRRGDRRRPRAVRTRSGPTESASGNRIAGFTSAGGGSGRSPYFFSSGPTALGGLGLLGRLGDLVGTEQAHALVGRRPGSGWSSSRPKIEFGAISPPATPSPWHRTHASMSASWTWMQLVELGLVALELVLGELAVLLHRLELVAARRGGGCAA